MLTRAAAPDALAAPTPPTPPQQQPPQQQPPDTGPRDRLDLYKAVGVGALVTVVAGVLDHDAVEQHQALAMAAVFCLGYAGIIAEDLIGFNKAGVALGTAVSLWVIRSTGGGGGGAAAGAAGAELQEALTQVSELIYFLVGAMAVVEVVDAVRRVEGGREVEGRWREGMLRVLCPAAVFGRVFWGWSCH